MRRRQCPSTRDRRPDYIVDTWRAGGKHHQPIKTQGNARGWWHQGQRLKKLFVQRITFTVNPLFFIHLQPETSALFELISTRYERRSMIITANQPQP